jgi:soluble lytic murein transglycosylase
MGSIGFARRGGPLLACALLAVLLVGSAPSRRAPLDTISFDAVDAALLARPGAALRHAIDSIASGETGRAEELLLAVARAHPVVADYADLERLRLYVLLGSVDEAIALAEAWDHDDSPLRVEVYRLAGRARADRSEEEKARVQWDLAIAATDERLRRAVIRLDLARSYLRSGLLEPAGEQLMIIWTHSPLSEQAAEADPLLDDLEERLGERLRTGASWRKRADVLYRARHNEAALEAYERSLELGGLSRASRRRAERQRAQTLFRMRRYTDATQAFAALPKNADNRIQHARSRARAGDVEGAAAELERIADDVRGGQGAYAKFLAALLWEGEGHEQRANVLYRSLAGGRTRHGASAQWRLGWEAYRGGRHEQALDYFGRLIESESDALGRLRARYWIARAREKAGRPDAAEEFGQIAREFPFSYYGWRASARAALGATTRPPYSFEPGDVALGPADLARPRILLEAGLEDVARAELDRLYVSADGVADRLALAELYAEAGDFHKPQRLVVGAYRETLARGPAPGRVELWWHAWPAPYLDAVLGQTDQRAGLAPELVYAIMREESGYRPEVRSVSGARGLLQLMPETAERVASREALPAFDVDDLFVPNVNIQLGSAYLGELLSRFSGRESAAIGSYNAGPHRVVEWLENSALDDDEWVEAIPYDQTRGYVKRVLRSMHVYRVLY